MRKELAFKDEFSSSLQFVSNKSFPNFKVFIFYYFIHKIKLFLVHKFYFFVDKKIEFLINYNRTKGLEVISMPIVVGKP